MEDQKTLHIKPIVQETSFEIVAEWRPAALLSAINFGHVLENASLALPSSLCNSSILQSLKSRYCPEKVCKTQKS